MWPRPGHAARPPRIFRASARPGAGSRRVSARFARASRTGRMAVFRRKSGLIHFVHGVGHCSRPLRPGPALSKRGIGKVRARSGAWRDDHVGCRTSTDRGRRQISRLEWQFCARARRSRCADLPESATPLLSTRRWTLELQAGIHLLRALFCGHYSSARLLRGPGSWAVRVRMADIGRPHA